MSVKLSSNVHDVIAKCKSIFFPDGESFFGRIEDMTSTLGNFKCEEISLPNFTLAKYINANGLTQIRLYLTTRCNEPESEESENELPVVFHQERERNHDDGQDSLIRTSAERESIKAKQDREYEEYLAIDRAKDIQKQKIEETTKRQLKLKNAQKGRVPPEPTADEASAVISVRLIALGIQRRNFKATDKMSAVYDWIGSLSTDPEAFVLSGCELPAYVNSLQTGFLERSFRSDRTDI